MSSLASTALSRPSRGFVSAGEVVELRSYFRVEQYASGAQIYGPETPADRAYLLRAGRVRLLRPMAPGAAHPPLLGLLRAGDLFGEVLRPAHEVMGETAVAYGETEVWSLEGRDLQALVEARPQLAMEIIRGLSERSRQLRQRTVGLTFKEVPARLAEQLLALVEAHGERCVHGASVDLRGVTQQDLADLVGASRSFVSTLINEMKRDGLLGSVGRTVCVRDREALKQFADTDRP